jgi:hypothetical protein
VQFLTEYQNRDDYWEIMNNNLAQFLTQTFSMIGKLEIELSVAPDEKVQFHRRSVVVYERAQFEELFGFKIQQQSNLQEHFENATLEVTYKYRPGIQLSEYPDFLWVSEAIDNFLITHWNASEKWEVVQPRLIKHLSDRFPMVTLIEIKLLA